MLIYIKATLISQANAFSITWQES